MGGAKSGQLSHQSLTGMLMSHLPGARNEHLLTIQMMAGIQIWERWRKSLQALLVSKYSKLTFLVFFSPIGATHWMPQTSAKLIATIGSWTWTYLLVSFMDMASIIPKAERLSSLSPFPALEM
jgi:hypothetical protein